MPCRAIISCPRSIYTPAPLKPKKTERRRGVWSVKGKRAADDVSETEETGETSHAAPARGHFPLAAAFDPGRIHRAANSLHHRQSQRRHAEGDARGAGAGGRAKRWQCSGCGERLTPRTSAIPHRSAIIARSGHPGPCALQNKQDVDHRVKPGDDAECVERVTPPPRRSPARPLPRAPSRRACARAWPGSSPA